VLAERSLMSDLTFTRAFHREVGQGPAAYGETLRIERGRETSLRTAAPRLKPCSSLRIHQRLLLRRAFHRHLGVSHGEYR